MPTKLQVILEASINDELVLGEKVSGEWRYCFLSCSQMLTRDVKHVVLLPAGDWFSREELLKRIEERKRRHG